MKAVLADHRSAPISAELRAMLGFLQRLTLEPQALGAADVAALRQAGLDDRAIEDAVDVSVAFAVINRVADALGFQLQTPEGYAFSAKMLLKRGYRI